MQMYIGTYIEKPKSIYKCDLGGKSAATIEAGPNPSFLCFNASRSRLYVVNELEKSVHGSFGEIRCFMRDAQNHYVEHSRRTSGGDAPCHIAICERLLFACNYGSGNLCVYALDENGGLEGEGEIYSFSGSGTHRERQATPHPHQAVLSPCEEYLLVCDLGCDCVYVFRIFRLFRKRHDSKNASQMNKKHLEFLHRFLVPSGGEGCQPFGPRHMAFSDCGAYLYVLGELSPSVIAYAWNNGTLRYIEQQPVFPAAGPYPENAAAEIVCYQKKIYISVRGDDSISVFDICDDGTLKYKGKVACGGKTPRSFAIFAPNTLGTLGKLGLSGFSGLEEAQGWVASCRQSRLGQYRLFCPARRNAGGTAALFCRAFAFGSGIAGRRAICAKQVAPDYFLRLCLYLFARHRFGGGDAHNIAGKARDGRFVCPAFALARYDWANRKTEFPVRPARCARLPGSCRGLRLR